MLNLITGDYPQCYVNDIVAFGMQRGGGESIWDIKQYIGYVSSALQWEYKVSVNYVMPSSQVSTTALVSTSVTPMTKIADRWLALLGMEAMANRPFNDLSLATSG